MFFLKTLSFLIVVFIVFVEPANAGQTQSRKAQTVTEEDAHETLKQITFEELSTPTQIYSIPNEVLHSHIYTQLDSKDLKQLSQSSKHFYHQTSQEREAWKDIRGECSHTIASSLQSWIDTSFKNYPGSSIWISSTYPWFLEDVPTHRCVASWHAMCLMGYRVPLAMDITLLPRELKSVWPSCFQLEGVALAIGPAQNDFDKRWNHLMKWITPQGRGLQPSRNIRWIGLINQTAQTLSPEQELVLLDFLENRSSTFEFISFTQFSFESVFSRRWAYLLRQQGGPLGLNLHQFNDYQSPDFLSTMLNAMKRNRSLKRLLITDSWLSQHSIRLLAEMMSQNQYLEALGILATEISWSNEDLLALVRACINHPCLKLLDLSGNSISEDMTGHLKRMVSDVKRDIKLMV